MMNQMQGNERVTSHAGIRIGQLVRFSYQRYADFYGAGDKAYDSYLDQRTWEKQLGQAIVVDMYRTPQGQYWVEIEGKNSNFEYGIGKFRLAHVEPIPQTEIIP